MLDVLNKFRDDVNGNSDVKRVTQGWSTDVVFEVDDGAYHYVMPIRNGAIADIKQDATPDELFNVTKVCGNRDVLEMLLSGKLNAIRAANNGDIQIYGQMNDQIRLDAIALILWGG